MALEGTAGTIGTPVATEVSNGQEVQSGQATGQEADSQMPKETPPEPEIPKEPTVIAVIANGKPVAMSGKPVYVYVDIFDYIDFDLSAPKGSGVVTLLNGREAKYMEPLKNGDNIEIYWKK